MIGVNKLGKIPFSESDLAKALIEWLKDLKWVVYQEVQMFAGCAIADIVATKGPIVWAIECKKSFTLKVMEQADGWTSWAHYVSVATGPAKNRVFAHDLCWRHLGIGVLQVAMDWDEKWFVTEKVPPRFRRKILPSLKNALQEEHKNYAEAGNNLGRRYTPFQGTCDRVRKAVRQNPGITLKQLIENVDHHYGSDAGARASIAQWTQGGIIKGIRCEREGRYLKFYSDDYEKNEN